MNGSYDARGAFHLPKKCFYSEWIIWRDLCVVEALPALDEIHETWPPSINSIITKVLILVPPPALLVPGNNLAVLDGTHNDDASSTGAEYYYFLLSTFYPPDLAMVQLLTNYWLGYDKSNIVYFFFLCKKVIKKKSLTF